MFFRLLRSTVFLKVMQWLIPKLWAQYKKRQARKKY